MEGVSVCLQPERLKSSVCLLPTDPVNPHPFNNTFSNDFQAAEGT